MRLDWLEYRLLAATRFNVAFRQMMKDRAINREALRLRSGIGESSINRMLYGGHNFTVHQAAALAASIGYELRFQFVATPTAVPPVPEKFAEWTPVI